MNNNQNCCRLSVDDNLIQNAKVTLQQHTSIEQQSKIFSLLGNEVRLKMMILFLNYERMCVCDLSDVLEMKQSPISQHLRKLKDAGLLEKKREGMTIFYFITPLMENEIKRILDDR